jgi:hypothetical protein
LQFGWFFGLVRVSVSDGWKKKFRKPGKPSKKKRKRNFPKGQFLKLITKPVILGLLRFVKDMFRCIHFKQFDADVRIGLGEPADTGSLFGLIHAVLPVFAAPCQQHMRFMPDFGDDAVLAGRSSGIIRLRPIMVISRTFKFVFSKPVLIMAGKAFKKWIIVK